MLLDTHYHFDFIPTAQRESFLSALAESEVRIVSQTLLPAQFVEHYPNAALGFHPWQVAEADVEKELAIFRENLPLTRLIGEIGLDFGPRHTSARQEHVFRSILSDVAKTEEPRVLSIHSVRATSAVLDHLADLPEHITKVIHWFSGTSDELTRLIRMGGLISVNPMMLQAKRGRAYVKQVPADRILLESDYPLEPPSGAGEDIAQELIAAIASTVSTISEIRGEDMAPVIKENQRRVFGGITSFPGF